MPRTPKIFAQLNQPYYIHAPHFQQASGGVRALHYLCHALNLIGEEAYICNPNVHPGLRTPVLTQTIMQYHATTGRSPIAVYPEVISDNPLGARNVVRYLLAVPALHTGHPIHLQPRDLVYTFGPTLVPQGWEADPLRMPLVDTRIFNCTGIDDSQRHGTAVFIHRHLKKGGELHPITADSIEISYRVAERSAQELADIFRRVECIYMYEYSTVCFEALLCGCPVIFITNNVSLPEPTYWLMDGKGISWSLEPADIARAKASVHEAADFYAEEEKTFWKDLASFVDKTQRHAVDLHGQPIQNEKSASFSIDNLTTNSVPGLVPTPVGKKRLVVLSAEPASGPCPYIRFTKPFALLDNEWELGWGIKDNNVDLNLLREADLIVMQRYAPGLFSLDTLKQLFALGKPVIYETDDLLNDIPDYHPQAASGRQWKEGIEYAARHAQAIVASTTYLADKLQNLNPAVYVLPNYLDFDLFYRPVPPMHDGQINIGLLGTSLQGPNFALVDVALHEICRRYPGKIRLFFVGWAPPAGWEHHPDASFVPVIDSYENYAAKLKQMNWDISLIPLADDPFNYSKTAIKWLEYSAAGIASVFSDVTIYRNAVTHDHSGMLVQDSPQAWIDAIASLIDNPQKRHDIAQTAQDEVRRHHSINDNAVHYGELYGRLLQDSVAQSAATAAMPAIIPAAAPATIQPQVTAPAKKRLLVFSVESTWSPCPQIRFILPFSFLTAEWELVWGIKNGKVDSSELSRADLIVLHRSAPGLFPHADLVTIFGLGKTVIYETDDLLNDIPDYHPQAADSKKWKSGIEYAVQHANAVVVSTPFLADKYRAMNPHVHVLQNYLDFDRFYRPVPVRNDGSVTIGLLGTSIQGPNFALVDQALRSICERFPGRIKLYFVGWNMPSSWEGHPAVEFLPFIHEYQSYAARLLEMQWDIALVPLVNDDFNHSKSAIKWLEYAAAGIAPVFSDVSVYRNVVEDGRTGLLVQESPAAWLEALTLLVENPQRRHDIAAAAQAEVRLHYALKEKSEVYALRYGAFAAGEFAAAAAENPPGTTPGVLLLDPKGNAAAVAASLRSLADSRFSDLVTIVLTTRDEVPAWTEAIRFVQVGADEYASAIGQLSLHPDFVWVTTLEAGNLING